LGHRQAEDFGAEFLLGRAAAAARDGDRFTLRVVGLPPEMSAGRDEAFARSLGRIVTSPVEIRARTLILATGVRGRFPDFPGVMECVGKSLFWCLHCDGYASIDRVVGVVGHDEEAVETAMDLLEFTPNVTIAAGRPEGFSVPRSRLADLGTHGIAAYPHGVLQYEHEAGQMRALVLDVPERMRIPVEQVYTVRTATPATDIARQLGIELNAAGYVVIDSEQNTNLPGVWAAGDSTSLHDHQVSAAVHEGGEAACAANYYLYSPEQRNPVREPD
jgi:thioredoxin reductase (NADPH)